MDKDNNYKILNRKIDLWARFFLFAFLFLCGGILNLAVVQRNGGRMPVYNPSFYFQSNTHFAYYDRADVNFWIATDIIDVKFCIISIGDIIVLCSFLGMIIVNIQMYKFRREKTKNA
jgi:hypothetical protein